MQNQREYGVNSDFSIQTVIYTSFVNLVLFNEIAYKAIIIA